MTGHLSVLAVSIENHCYGQVSKISDCTTIIKISTNTKDKRHKHRMRIRFFAPVTQLPQQPAEPLVQKLAKEVDEEMISKDDVTSSMYDEDESTSLDEDSFDMSNTSAEEKANLPEMSNDQADLLKRLLLSPLEPEYDF